MKPTTSGAFLVIFASSTLFVRGFLANPKYQKKHVANLNNRCFARQFLHLSDSALSTSEDAAAASTLDEQISSNLQILARAACTKDVDSDAVCSALSDLEKQMRQKARENPDVAADMKRMLNGSWRLIFTTGTGETQKKYGKINYFPLKAVQTFRTVDYDPMEIENGIYLGDFPLIRFSGTMEFDLKKRRLEFDFDQVLVLSVFDIKLGKGDAARLGSTSGLGSDSNVKNAEKGRNAFFNWISADETIATARGAGGGLALWKRVQ
jgi:PAP_fibrillin